MPLTDTKCRAAQPKEKKYKLADTQGLYLEVMPSGAKYWRLKFRLDGKEKRLALGVYPGISLSEARSKKLEAKDDLKRGVNLTLKRLEQKQTAGFCVSQTFEQIAQEWHGKQINTRNPRYAHTVLYRLEKYLFPDLASYPVRLIKPITILCCLQKIEKTAPEMARRIRQYCKYIFLYAIATDHLDTDPSYGLEHALIKYKKGHFAAITVDEVPKFLFDLHEYKARLTRQTFLAIKFLLLTFVRTSELVKATWQEIDFEKSMWTIPAERMKMKRPHLVPLSRQALEILAELKEVNGKREYVFPGISQPRKHMSKGTILVALKRMGYKNRMTGHGFRSLAMGIIKEKLNYPHHVVDRQLAHAPKNGNDKAYDRALYLIQRTEMMQSYADYLDKTYVDEVSKNILGTSPKYCTGQMMFQTA